MARKRSTDWQRVIIKLLREAWVTSRILRERGCWPSSYQSAMPDYIKDFWESYGTDKATIDAPPPTGVQIDRLDMVMAAMATPQLSIHERQLLWDRAGNKPWKDILWRRHVPERSLKRHYSQALAVFAMSLTDNEANKIKRAA